MNRYQRQDKIELSVIYLVDRRTRLPVPNSPTFSKMMDALVWQDSEDASWQEKEAKILTGTDIL